MKLSRYLQQTQTQTVYPLKSSGNTGYKTNITWESTGSVMCNIQPYSGGLALNEYGLTVNCRLRLFCAPDAQLDEGMGVALCPDSLQPDYTVTYVGRYKSHTVALMDKVV